MKSTKEIFTCNDFSIYRHVPESPIEKIVVVCFDEINGGLNKRGFGTEFLLKNNVENFFVSHAKKSFFQGLSEEDLFEHLAPYLVDKKVFTFGASLGGYAALYYSDILCAKAISFSPRCSADPLYGQAKRLGVTYRHRLMSSKTINSRIWPVVVVDPDVPMDRKFLDQRILPCYKNEISLLELRHGSHYTARALSSQGLLKEFVLNIIKHDNLIDVDFDAENNAISLSCMALSAANEGKFDDANRYLEKLALLEKQPNDAMRLKAYLVLSEKGKLDHKFSLGSIFPSEKRLMYNWRFSRFKEAKTPRETLLVQAETHIKLLEFQKAMEIAKEAMYIYPKPEEAENILKRSEKLYFNTEQFLLP